MRRSINNREISIINRLLSFSENRYEFAMSNEVTVDVVDEYNSIVLEEGIVIGPSERNETIVGLAHDVPTTERPEALVEFILFIRRGFLKELQILKQDGSGIIREIEAEEIWKEPG